MRKTEFIGVNFPKDHTVELKLWKQAFSTVAARTVSYGEMLRIILDCLVESRPEEASEMKQMLEKHPELKETVHLKFCKI